LGSQFIKKVKDIKPIVKAFLMTAFRIDDIEFRTDYPPEKEDDNLVAYTLTITLGDNTHTTGMD
jgi:hypothetical protein